MPTIVDIANVQARTEDWSWNPNTLSWSVFDPNSLAQANNNPGNLLFMGQPGATKGRGGFARFSSVEAGFQAEQNQIALDASRGISFGAFLEKMTPKKLNPNFDPNVPASRLGVGLNDKLSDIIGNIPTSPTTGSGTDETSTVNDVMPNDASFFDFIDLSSMSMEMKIGLVVGGVIGGYYLLK